MSNSDPTQSACITSGIRPYNNNFSTTMPDVLVTDGDADVMIDRDMGEQTNEPRAGPGEEDAENHDVQEALPPQGQPAPYTPTQSEIDNHNLSHLPYRSWCPLCVRGKGKASPHRAHGSHHEAGVPVISIDYKFLCDSEELERDAEEADGDPCDPRTGKKLKPLLVFYDARTKGIYAHSPERKGTCPGACRLIVDDLNRLGYRKIVLKSDGEPALVTFTESLIRAWNGEVVPELSRKGESQSNGEVERAIQTLSGQVRTMKLQWLQPSLTMRRLFPG